jgi:hypothetical protein
LPKKYEKNYLKALNTQNKIEKLISEITLVVFGKDIEEGTGFG